MLKDRGEVVQGEVHSLRRLHGDYYLQRFAAWPLAYDPGQFVMVKPAGSLDPFLPRAYSILRVASLPGRSRRGEPTVVEILYKVIGKGTTALAQLRPGDRVDLLGPLGTGFRLPRDLQTVLLVAGGIGVPPVVALAERFAGSRVTGHGSRKNKNGHRTSGLGRPGLVAFVGGKTRHDVLCVHDFRTAGATVRTATEDGSLGHRGFVTDLLESYLRSSVNGPRRAQSSRHRSAIFACGPHPMLEAVARIAERYRVSCQVSLEADMGCGFGACMGCVIPMHSSGFRVQGSRKHRTMNHEPSTMNQVHYKLCCKDGPVFDAREIAW
jgi:dihydroorotate dehydrogenase electron transfer subunit